LPAEKAFFSLPFLLTSSLPFIKTTNLMQRTVEHIEQESIVSWAHHIAQTQNCGLQPTCTPPELTQFLWSESAAPHLSKAQNRNMGRKGRQVNMMPQKASNNIIEGLMGSEE
jgi:hypothetical protein